MTTHFSDAAWAVFDAGRGGAVDAALHAEDVTDQLLHQLRQQGICGELLELAQAAHAAADAAYEAAMHETLQAIEVSLREGALSAPDDASELDGELP